MYAAIYGPAIFHATRYYTTYFHSTAHSYYGEISTHLLGIRRRFYIDGRLQNNFWKCFTMKI